MSEHVNNTYLEEKIKNIPKNTVVYGTTEHEIIVLKKFVKEFKEMENPSKYLVVQYEAALEEIEKLEQEQKESEIAAQALLNKKESNIEAFKKMFKFNLKGFLEGLKLSVELFKNRKPGKRLQERYNFDNFKVRQ